MLYAVAGSPADKDNLEVGDEILEVNGKTLEDANHSEVINHIHQVRFSSKRFIVVVPNCFAQNLTFVLFAVYKITNNMSSSEKKKWSATG